MEPETFARSVGHELKKQGLLLTTAESCTGGWVAQIVTSVSGSSEWFERGFVTYTNISKREMLGVKTTILSRHGAVSEPTARAMAEGALANSHAQVAVAITGIAGPTGGTPEKPVGLVFIGLATPTGTQVQRHLIAFDRETFKFFVSQTALDMLRRELMK